MHFEIASLLAGPSSPWGTEDDLSRRTGQNLTTILHIADYFLPNMYSSNFSSA